MQSISQNVSTGIRNDSRAMSVLRKTYLLLSATLLTSSLCAYLSLRYNVLQPNLILLLIGMYGLYFLTVKLRNSSWGVLAIFLYTSFMGYLLGPILNLYIKNFSNGPQIVSTAIGATGLLFLSLSFYTVVKRKDFSYLGGFLFAAIMIAFLGAIAGYFFTIPMLQLLVSGAFAIISCGFILFTTSAIIHGGEDNYIMATISLYIAIFNLFISLLRLLSIFGGRR